MLNVEPYKTQAIFADVNGRLESLKRIEINPYHLSLQISKNEKNKDRYIRPDLVLFDDSTARLEHKNNFDLFEHPILNYINVKVELSDRFAKYYPSIVDIYEKYLQENIKYKKNPCIENKWIASFFKEEFLNEVTKALYSFSNIDHLDNRGILLRDYCIKIVDYKYMRVSDYQDYNPLLTENGENKITSDIHKQLIYEWTTQQNFENAETSSEFWIPYFSPVCNLSEDELPLKRVEITPNLKLTNQSFIDSKIKIMKADFRTLQNYYIKQQQLL